MAAPFIGPLRRDPARWHLVIGGAILAAGRGARREAKMTLCPIAIMAGCAKCPAFKVCPLKTVIGDQRPAPGGGAQGPGAGGTKQ